MSTAPDLIAYYFSGTGNSWRLAMAAVEEARRGGLQAEVWSMERGLHPEHRAAAYHGFFFPVYAFGLPPIVARFLAALPPVTEGRAFLAAALGDILPPPSWLPGYEGSAIAQAAWILGRKGYRQLADLPANAPENYVLVGNTPPPETCAAILGAGERQAQEAWRSYVAGGRVHRHRLLLWRLLTLPIYWGWRLIGRRISGKSFIADERCIGCSECARRCPTGAIVMERGRPRWRWHCENCLRCAGTCPRGAVQVSWLLLLAYLALPFVWNGDRAMKALRLDHVLPAWATWPVGLLLYAVGLVVLAVLIDNAVRFLTRFRPFRRLLAVTGYTRRFRKYLAPGFPPIAPSQGAVTASAEPLSHD
jgi:NAD-dependent dihydropyrimidine dehydrogenase PreA subunit